jgi:hypothetical protein
MIWNEIDFKGRESKWFLGLEAHQDGVEDATSLE